MSYVDEEKRNKSIGYIIEHLNTLDTKNKVDDFIKKVSPLKLKTIIKEGYLKAGDEGTINIENLQVKKDNDESMAVEIDSL